MKKFFLLFSLVFPVMLFAGGENTSSAYWSNDFRKARLRARETGKNLFLLFTISDGDYHNKRAIQQLRYSSRLLKDGGEDFVFLHIDCPRNKKQSLELAAQNKRLKNRFGVSFFPAIVLVSPTSPWGGLLYRYNGVPASTGEFLQEVRKKIKRPKPRPKSPETKNTVNP